VWPRCGNASVLPTGISVTVIWNPRRWCEEATKLRQVDAKETRDARRLVEKYSVKKAQVAPDNSGEFRAWLWDYIGSHYQNANTRKRMKAAWERLASGLIFAIFSTRARFGMSSLKTLCIGERPLRCTTRRFGVEILLVHFE
jgi:hypothetical protein